MHYVLVSLNVTKLKLLNEDIFSCIFFQYNVTLDKLVIYGICTLICDIFFLLISSFFLSFLNIYHLDMFQYILIYLYYYIQFDKLETRHLYILLNQFLFLIVFLLSITTFDDGFSIVLNVVYNNLSNSDTSSVFLSL